MKNMFKMYEKQNQINEEELKLMTSALDFQKKEAKDVMTPIEKIYKLDINQRLDQDLLNEIYDQGFSRIPVYEKNPSNIVGILLSKDLIILNPKVLFNFFIYLG
jgi:metal transporter CNNM